MEYGFIKLKIKDSEYKKMQEEIYKCMEDTDATIWMELKGKICGWTTFIHYKGEKLASTNGYLIYTLTQNGYKMDKDFELEME